MPLGLAGMLFLLLVRPVYDVDIFWQLKLGELILATGGPVAAEPFAAAHLGEPLPPLAWLGQAAYAQARLLGGWTAVRVFDAVVWVGGFWAVAAACRRTWAPPLAALVAVGVGFMAAMPCASLRPQSFAALGFGLLLALVRLNLSPTRILLFAAPLLVLWQNLHPSVTVAAVAVGSAAAVGWVRWAAGFRSRPWALTGLTAVVAAAVCATPAGWPVLAVSADNARMSLALGVNEWRPPWVAGNRSAGLTFAAAAVVSAWLLVRNRRRIDWEELAPAAALFVLTLTAHRFALFFGLAVVPPLARVLTARPVVTGGPYRPGTWLVVLLAVPAALLVRPTHFHESLPLAGVARLKETGIGGTVYCHYAWGGPLIDAGHPDWAVAFDGRYYRYTADEWGRYAAGVRGEFGVAELDRVYRPAAYFLRPGLDDVLIAALRADGGWREVYADRVCAAFVRSR
ncbi:MAG: hypothetical protein C0501_09085 [Isosphaera sp.]|nr:hypothetical protein [Isosphaera sp.]